jgi:hypothetical protein
MLFLATILFVALLYVIPGFLLLDGLVKAVSIPFVPDAVLFWTLSLLLYIACVVGLRFARHVYEELQLDRESFQIKRYLDARALRWLTLVAIGFIGWQFWKMSGRWAMPPSFVPLYVALLLGFFDLRRRPVIDVVTEELPESRFGTTSLPETPADASVTLRWEYLAKAGSTELKEYEIELPVHGDDVTKAAGTTVELRKPEDYARFVTTGPMDDLHVLAARLREESIAGAFSPLEEAENVVYMVRSLAYASDAVGATDQPKYPIQTLADGGGDCEDLAMLAASLLWQLGHPVALLYVELGDSIAHMALGYAAEGFEGSFSASGPDGRTYAYLETVPSAEAMGEIPAEFLDRFRNVVVVPI